jgi:RNA polymerase sigma-70 factor, ECF subfamily
MDDVKVAVDRTTQFELCRERMRRLAYRLLGAVGDADDIVQEAYLKWSSLGESEVSSPEAWLTTVVTRLCIDRLRARRREENLYVGSWLPEPLYIEDAISTEDITADLSLALLVLLERLTPEERATYLLHDIFDYKYRDISNVVGKTEVACRQLLHRARKRVREGHPRYQVSDSAKNELVLKFVQALENNDQALLISVLEEDATITTDGGGRVKAALNVVHGNERIAKLLLGIRKKKGGSIVERVMRINGELGVVTYVGGIANSLVAFQIDQGRVGAIYRILDPIKLKAVPKLPGDPAREFDESTPMSKKRKVRAPT